METYPRLSPNYHFFISLFILLYFISCSNKKEREDFHVKYEVEILTDIPLKVLIGYKDSISSEYFYSSDKLFSKEVCLHPDSLASLVVTASIDLDRFLEYNMNNPQWWVDEMLKRNYVRGKIIHKNKTVSESSKNIILMTLTPRECNMK